MIVPYIKFDRVTVCRKDPDYEDVHEGCFVSLRKDGTVVIDITGGADDDWCKRYLVMTSHKLVELTLGQLIFEANLADRHGLRRVMVKCEFNVFSKEK